MVASEHNDCALDAGVIRIAARIGPRTTAWRVVVLVIIIVSFRLDQAARGE